MGYRPIPAPGFKLISGKRNPPSGEDVKYWVQLRADAGVDCVGKPGWFDGRCDVPDQGPALPECVEKLRALLVTCAQAGTPRTCASCRRCPSRFERAR